MPKKAILKATLKVRTNKEKIIKWKMDAVCYGTCPYCKKTILMAEPEIMGYLKRWLKQKKI